MFNYQEVAVPQRMKRTDTFSWHSLCLIFLTLHQAWYKLLKPPHFPVSNLSIFIVPVASCMWWILPLSGVHSKTMLWKTAQQIMLPKKSSMILKFIEIPHNCIKNLFLPDSVCSFLHRSKLPAVNGFSSLLS